MIRRTSRAVERSPGRPEHLARGLGRVRSGRRLALCLAATAVGAGVAIQSKLLGSAASASDSVLVVGWGVFVYGAALSVLAVVGRPSGRERLRRALRGLLRKGASWWPLTSGAGGAAFVVSQGLAADVMGVALFTTGVVAGQVVSGAVFDMVGVSGIRRGPSVGTWASIALACGAVIVGGASAFDVTYLPSILVAFVGGCAGAWGSATGSRIYAESKDLGVAALLNFAVGFVLVGMVATVMAGAGSGQFSPLVDPRVAAGGALGVVSIAATSWLILRLGILAVGTAVVAGQALGGLVIDAAISNTDALQAATVCAAVLTVAAAALSGVASRAPSPSEVS